MNLNFFLTITITIFAQFKLINTEREILDNKDKTYCYRFTWLGPAFNNETNLGNTDITCSDLITTNNQNPCRQPFLITEDGTYPDMHYVWDNYEETVRCELTLGQYCIRYSHLTNDVVQNITYMCGKIDVQNEATPKRGCFKQKLSNRRVIEMCFCKTASGDPYPCNSSISLNKFSYLLFAMFISILLIY